MIAIRADMYLGEPEPFEKSAALKRETETHTLLLHLHP